MEINPDMLIRRQEMLEAVDARMRRIVEEHLKNETRRWIEMCYATLPSQKAVLTGITEPDLDGTISDTEVLGQRVVLTDAPDPPPSEGHRWEQTSWDPPAPVNPDGTIRGTT